MLSLSKHEPVEGPAQQCHTFALSLSKGNSWFDKLTTNVFCSPRTYFDYPVRPEQRYAPFGLSLSKALLTPKNMRTTMGASALPFAVGAGLKPALSLHNAKPAPQT